MQFVKRWRLAIAFIVAIVLVLVTEPCRSEAYPTSKIAQWEQVAYNYWASQGIGGECLGYITNRQVDIVNGDDEIVGMAYSGCYFEVKRGLSDYDACVTVVHEIGHLLGQDHQSDGIMAPNLTDSGIAFKPCASVVPPVVWNFEAHSWIEDRWEMWSLRCKAIASNRRFCWGVSINGKRMRFIVTKDADYKLSGRRIK